jgi:hypothetical protein
VMSQLCGPSLAEVAHLASRRPAMAKHARRLLGKQRDPRRHQILSASSNKRPASSRSAGHKWTPLVGAPPEGVPMDPGTEGIQKPLLERRRRRTYIARTPLYNLSEFKL